MMSHFRGLALSALFLVSVACNLPMAPSPVTPSLGGGTSGGSTTGTPQQSPTPSTGVKVARLALTGPASVTAGTCAAYAVTAEDANEAPVSTPSDIDLQWTGTAGILFEDADCKNEVTTLTIPQGAKSASYYLSATGEGTFSASWSAQALPAPGIQVNVLPAAASALSLTSLTVAPGEYNHVVVTNAGACLTFQISAVDSYGNPASVGGSSINLKGPSGSNFFSDSQCQHAISNATMGESGTLVYWMPTVAELSYAQQIVVDSTGSSLTSAQLSVVVRAGPVSQVVLRSANLSAPNPLSVTTGDCLTLYAFTADAFGNLVAPSSNLTISFSGAQNGGIYSGYCNGSAAPSIQITPTTMQITYLGFGDKTVEDVTLMASASDRSIAPASLKISVTAPVITPPPPPANPAVSIALFDQAGNVLAANSPIESLRFYGCEGPFYVDTTDANGKPVDTTTDVGVTFPGFGYVFSSDTCDANHVISTTTIASGTRRQAFYLYFTPDPRSPNSNILGQMQVTGNISGVGKVYATMSYLVSH